MPTIKLQSSDGKLFRVDSKTVKGSMTIMKMLQKVKGNLDHMAVQLENVDAEVLTKILDWMEYHKDDPATCVMTPGVTMAGSCNLTNFVEWDAEFLEKQTPDELFALISAANYLGIPGLVDTLSRKTASMIRGKSVDEIRQTFGIKDNGFASGEYEQVLRENEWISGDVEELDDQ